MLMLSFMYCCGLLHAIAQFLLGSAPYTYTLPNSVVADQYPPQSGIDRIAPHAKELRVPCLASQLECYVL